MTPYTATGFDFVTTNNVAFQDFRFSKPEKAVFQKPELGAVVTKAPSAHFITTNKKELKRLNYKKPAIDRIPYP